MRRIRLDEIPQDIIEANGMKFNHERNEYNLFHPSGFFCNIPSNIDVSIHPKGIAVEFVIGNVRLILWRKSCNAPHLTILK